MLKLPSLAAMVALACAIHTTAAHAQASQIPPGKQCFQANVGISGQIGSLGFISGGSGGTNGTYGNVPLIGTLGGTGGTATIVVSGGAVTSVTIMGPGVNYFTADNLTAAPSNIGGVTGFSVPINSTSVNSSLAGGAVGMYVPGTLTPKQTFMDAGETILNQNPVQLDLNGCAVMYGTGVYRQVVYDRLGNTVWDQPTTVFAQNPIYAGLAGGTANAITVTDTAFSGTDGQSITFLASITNTGATTLNPSGFGAISIVKNTGSGPVALVAGDIVGGSPGNLYTVTYSSAFNEFFISNLVATGGGGGTSVPSGAVMAFALTSCPSGWVNANGTGGTVNMLGAVARGLDPSNTRDPNGSAQSVGSFESAQMQQHTMSSPAGTFVLFGAGLSIAVAGGSSFALSTTSSTTGNVNGASVGNETRAAATVLLYCQKS